MKSRGERAIGKPCDRRDPGAKSKSNLRGQDWCLPRAAWLAFYFVVRCCSFGRVYEIGERMDGKRGGKGRKGKGKGYQGVQELPMSSESPIPTQHPPKLSRMSKTWECAVTRPQQSCPGPHRDPTVDGIRQLPNTTT